MSNTLTPGRLTIRQRKFIEEYLIDESSTGAAIRAGYSIKTARQAGIALLKHPNIITALAELTGDRLKKMGVTQDRVLQELAMIAFANIQDIVEQDEAGNTTVNIKKIKREQAAALSGIDVETSNGRFGNSKKVKISLQNKLAALDKIGKHLGLFKEQIEHTGTLTLEELVKHSFERKEDKNVIEGEIVEVPKVTDVNHSA